MVKKMLKSFGDRKNWSTKWQHFKIIGLDLVPVSVKLKSNIRTPKARIITKKVERALLNERIRSINNTIAMATSKRDTCMNTLWTSSPRKS